MNLDYLGAYGKELFAKLKIKFEVLGSHKVLDKKDLKEVLSASDQNVSDKELAQLLAKQAKRKAQLNKIQDNIGKLEAALAKDVEPQKIGDKVTQYENILAEMWKEAKEDGEVDDNEKEAIKSVTDYISTLKIAVKIVPEMNLLIEKSKTLLKAAKKTNKTQ